MRLALRRFLVCSLGAHAAAASCFSRGLAAAATRRRAALAVPCGDETMVVGKVESPATRPSRAASLPANPRHIAGVLPPTAPNCRRLPAKRACSELRMNIKLQVSCNATALIGARGAAPVDLREPAISQSRVVYRRAAFILLLLSAPLGGPARAATPPDTVVMGKGIDDIVSLDPAEVYEVSGAEVVGNVYDRLIEGDPRDPAQIRAGLATAWSVDSSGRVFTFKLRRDTRFATGAPVTAGDAAFSLQRAIALDKAPALVLRQLGFTRDNVAARVRAAERYVLDANPDYWGGTPANRHVFVRHIKEAATQRLMLLRGDIDYARDLDKDQLEAIKHLIDYVGIAHAILGPTRIVHEAFEPQGYLGAIDDLPFRYDPARAKALLASADLAEGFAVTIDVRNASPWTEVAQALQSGFAEAGITLAIVPGDGKQVLTKYRARHHDIFLGEWGTDYPDPHSNAEAFALNEDNSDAAQKKTPAWRNSWSDPAMNAQVAAAMAERDDERRAALYRALQRAHQQAAPFAFMFQLVETAAHPATIDGFLIGAGPAENRYAGIARR